MTMQRSTEDEQRQGCMVVGMAMKTCFLLLRAFELTPTIPFTLPLAGKEPCSPSPERTNRGVFQHAL